MYNYHASPGENYYYLNEKAREFLEKNGIKVLREHMSPTLTCVASVTYQGSFLWNIDMIIGETRFQSFYMNNVTSAFTINIFPVTDCVWTCPSGSKFRPKKILPDTDEFQGSRYFRDTKTSGKYSLYHLINNDNQVMVIS